MKQERIPIHQVDARIRGVRDLGARQHVLTLEAPEIARNATPGCFVYLSPGERMRSLPRPFSVLWAYPEEGTVEVLYKVVGIGTEKLAQVHQGEVRRVLGPIGRGFSVDEDRIRPLLIGGGVGIPPILFLTRKIHDRMSPLVLMGSEIPFPFPSRPSAIRVPGMPEEVIAGMGLLEDWEVASRLCSLQGYPGCHQGYVDGLARRWIETQSEEQRAQIALYACGPMPMLRAVARLAEDFALPCQVSVEEYMACAVGGCAGCTIPVRINGEVVMRRVCVDGPVFDAGSVFFDRE